MGSEEKRYALLIDSDNVSAKYIDTIFDELADRGMVTVLSLQHCARHQPCAGSPRHRIRFSNGSSSAAPLCRRKYSFSSDGRQAQTAS